MKKIIVLFLIFGNMGWGLAQEISGKVLTEEGLYLSKVLIINIKSGTKSYSDNEGEFYIEAKNTDEIRLVSEGYERISYFVKVSDFGQKLTFKMKKSAQEIPEVVITKVSKEKLDELDKSIGVPRTNWKPRDKVREATDIFSPLLSLSPAINLQAIEDVITGTSRRRKALYQYEDFQENVAWVKDRVGVAFFQEKGVPEERVTEFITFVITEKAEIKNAIKRRDIRQIEKLMEAVLPVYLKRLSEHYPQNIEKND